MFVLYFEENLCGIKKTFHKRKKCHKFAKTNLKTDIENLQNIFESKHDKFSH
jgi:hypothetical protein